MGVSATIDEDIVSMISSSSSSLSEPRRSVKPKPLFIAGNSSMNRITSSPPPSAAGFDFGGVAMIRCDARGVFLADGCGFYLGGRERDEWSDEVAWHRFTLLRVDLSSIVARMCYRVWTFECSLDIRIDFFISESMWVFSVLDR